MLGSSEPAMRKNPNILGLSLQKSHKRPTCGCWSQTRPGGTALILMVSISALLPSIRESYLNLDTKTVTWESQSTCNLYFEPWRHHWNLKALWRGSVRIGTSLPAISAPFLISSLCPCNSLWGSAELKRKNWGLEKSRRGQWATWGGERREVGFWANFGTRGNP